MQRVRDGVWGGREDGKGRGRTQLCSPSGRRVLGPGYLRLVVLAAVLVERHVVAVRRRWRPGGFAVVLAGGVLVLEQRLGDEALGLDRGIGEAF